VRSIPATPRSKKERIYAALRQDILALVLRPGAVLVETALSRRFAASKTPVREALALLQQDGLLEAMPRRGYLVTAVSVDDVHELFELRMALESAAAELAAQRITPEEIEHLESLTLPADAASRRRGLRSTLDRNRAFHVAIARASRNERLARLVGRTIDEMTRLVAMGHQIGEHRQITAALRTGDAQRARAAIIDHIAMTKERVLKRQLGGAAAETDSHDPGLSPGDS
jgi:DNA-binding GntR family transcriptional regulator